MIDAALSFVFLYAILWLFERKHTSFDAFLVAIAVIIPILVGWLIRIGGFFLGLEIWALLGAFIAGPIVTYLALDNILGIPARRAIGYSAALFVFQLGLGIGSGVLFGLF